MCNIIAKYEREAAAEEAAAEARAKAAEVANLRRHLIPSLLCIVFHGSDGLAFAKGVPGVNARLVEVPRLERSTKSGGKDKIDHPKGLHDDVANAAAGALVLAYQQPGFSPGQRLRDNIKMAEVYKKWARSVA